MKLPYTEVKFYPEVKSQTGLSSLRVSCKRAHRKKITKANFSCSSWEEIFFGVRRRSILGPLLFNIFLCDLFFIMNEADFASYADDNTSYRTANTINEVIQSLQHYSIMLIKWFTDNKMKANLSKCHPLVKKMD